MIEKKQIENPKIKAAVKMLNKQFIEKCACIESNSFVDISDIGLKLNFKEIGNYSERLTFNITGRIWSLDKVCDGNGKLLDNPTVEDYAKQITRNLCNHFSNLLELEED